MRKIRTTGVAFAMAGVLLFTGCSAGNSSSKQDSGTKEAESSAEVLSLDAIKKGSTEYGISCHDPQIIYADGLFQTGK